MRTTGKTAHYCACCGFDCSPPDKDGNALEFCPARDGDFCAPKRRGKAPVRSKPREKAKRRVHSRSGTIRCPICAPLRCSRAP